jgi:hypothetical protein
VNGSSHVNNSGEKRQGAKVANWPSAKTTRTSSIFDTNTPSGPYRAIGTLGQNSREKHHVLGFWPTLWPPGGINKIPGYLRISKYSEKREQHLNFWPLRKPRTRTLGNDHQSLIEQILACLPGLIGLVAIDFLLFLALRWFEKFLSSMPNVVNAHDLSMYGE